MAKKFGQFWLHEKIGHGGMAEIFRATIGPDPTQAHFDFALKRPHAHLLGDRDVVDQFFTEADVAKFLRHPNLVQVYEAGLVGDYPYISMQYVPGLDLERFMQLLRHRGWSFPLDMVVFVACQLLRGLDYVHGARAPGGEPLNLVHRDVTPGNIFLTYDGKVLLSDFGIARIGFMHGRDEPVAVMGKAAYMSPEALTGRAPKPSDDLWSLGVCMLEMMAGRSVYGDASFGFKHSQLGQFLGGHPQLLSVLAQALHLEEKRRFAQSVDFYRGLKAYFRVVGAEVSAGMLSQFIGDVTGGVVPDHGTHARDAGPLFAHRDYYSPVGRSLTERIGVLPEVKQRWAWLKRLRRGQAN